MLKASATSTDTAPSCEFTPEAQRVFWVGPRICAPEIQPILAQEAFAVTHYADGIDFMAADHGDQIGCLVVEVSEGDESAVQVLDHAVSAKHRLAVIVLADGQQLRLAVQALRAGAHDVMQRPVAVQSVIGAIRSALAALKCSPAFEQTLERTAALKALAGLTDRQRDILGRIVNGQSNKAIAADMGVSQRTIENHRATIMKRMRVSSAPALIRMSIAAR